MERTRWILLVEDNEDDVILMHRAIEKQGIEALVVTARDGADALDLLHSRTGFDDSREQYPDLILLDINLPRLNGIEVLQRIRSNPATRLLRVVMFTTSGQERDLQRSYEGGASSYIRKPIASNGYQQIVKSIGNYWLNVSTLPPMAIGD